MSTMCSITIKRGKTSRRLAIAQEPFPKVGDIVTVKGEGAEWTVTRAKLTQEVFSIKFPEAKARRLA